VDTYGVKKALPNVIIALILANFSLFITRMVVDIANIGIVAIINNFEGGSVGLINQLLGTFIHGGRDTLGRLIEDFSTNQGGGVYESAIKKVVFVSAIYTAGGYLVLGAVLLAALAIIVPSVFILILAVLFYVRTYVILALAAVSPLAFIAFALPAGQVLFRQWWTQLARWAFMGPIAFFMIWLGITFTKAFGDQFEFGIYLVALTMLYLAISLPFKMGGVITGNLGKYLGKPLRQAGGFGARWYGRTSDVLSGQLSSKLGGRRITPMGLYKGWGANADRYYQRHLADTSGRGEDIREAVTSGAMAFMPWRFGERGAGAKRAFDIMFRGAGVHQQMALAKQISEGANRAAALPEHLVAEGLQDALNRNDPAKAADYLVAKAMQKQDIQADLYDLASRGMAGRPEVSAAMAKAQQTSIENGRPVINPADQDPGYNALERTKKALGNKSPAEQKGIAALWARAVKSDPGNPSHELMAQVIRDVFAPVAITDEVAQALGKFEAVGEVKEIQVDPTAMREAEEFIGQHLSQADFGARFRTGFGLQSGQALNPKSLAALTALQNYQSDNKAKSILADFNSQLESLKNASDINAVARHVSFGSFNTATPASAGVMRAGELLINNSAIGAHFKTNLQTVKNQAVAEIRKVNAVIAREVETQNIDHTVHFNLQAKLNKLAIDPAAKQRASEQLRNLWAHSELERNSLLAKERFSPADKKTKGWLFGRKGQS
ncbi:hypothetical protein HYZ64_02370, partial [Candidatus Berkelbacteria bacterium]|nr:hypothetical protein [Candidatus Berkelbacteria bacterium]